MPKRIDDEEHGHRQVEQNGGQRQEDADNGRATLEQRRRPAFFREGLQLFLGYIVGRDAPRGPGVPEDEVERERSQRQVQAESSQASGAGTSPT